MRKCLIEEEWDESGPSVTNSLGIVTEDVMLETHEGEDMIVVLFRREEARGFGPPYGFRMQAMEPQEDIREPPEHVLEGDVEGWVTIILANLMESVDSCLSLGKRDPERGVTWVT